MSRAGARPLARSAARKAWPWALVAAAMLGGAGRAGEMVGTVRRIEVDLSNEIGAIRPLHGVNGGPIAEGFFLDLSKPFRALGVPWVRLLAPNFPGVDCVSVHHIFRNPAADPDDPFSYDFERTDDYIAAIMAVGAAPIYCLGYGLEVEKDRRGNYTLNGRTGNVPPADFKKFARVCANIARHYNDGWARGFRYGIRYWEVWNEPNTPLFWADSVERYAELYAEIAAAIRQFDPALKVGGPAIALRTVGEGTAPKDRDWMEKFLTICRERRLPVDFFSWHSYEKAPVGLVRRAAEVRQLLDRHGFAAAENHLTEWSPRPNTQMRQSPFAARDFFDRNGSEEGAAFDAATLVLLQDCPVDVAAFYAGDTLRWGFMDRHGAPKKSFYGLKAFREMFVTPLRVAATGGDMNGGLAVMAGLARNRSQAKVLISHHQVTRDRPVTYEVRVRGLPWRNGSVAVRRAVDQQRDLDVVTTNRFDPGSELTIRFESTGPAVQVLELKDERADSESLPVLLPIQVSSTLPDRDGLGQLLVEKWRDIPEKVFFFNDSSRDQLYWVNDPVRDRAPWIVFDLGIEREISGVRLGFPNVTGKYEFLPARLEFASSREGRSFQQVGVARVEVPEGGTHEDRTFTFPVAAWGRFLRMQFEIPAGRPAGQEIVRLRSVEIAGR